MGEFVRAAELALTERLRVSGCIFLTKRTAGHVVGDGDLGDEGFGEAVGVDDVAIERVLAWGHGREGDAEVAGACKDRMEVESGVHLGFADGVEMHEVAVVGEEVVVRAGSTFTVWLVGEYVEVELVAGEQRF